MRAPTPAARLEGLGLHFARGRRTVLDGVTFGLGAGEIVALLGANGAGKSTLFRLLLGFLAAERGEVRLDGAPLSTYSRREIAKRVAYVPQGHVTPFPYTVREVVTLGRLPETGFLRAPRAQDREIVESVIARLGIEWLIDRPYTEISGGERQLALIARALAQGARLLVMDEPATGLDYGYQLRLLRHLSDLAADGHGVLVSTHHPEHAMQVATRIAILHEGRIDADGAPQAVVTAERMRHIYGVDVEVFDDPFGARRLAPVVERHGEAER
ncbi:ABC transporter ATP-binding protein [Methylosinus sp. H3A]|uniref:ABC transporter ATP-binding protein n=1 Tax=Methylosinus sp. H3A TaxID=2785786 RepID=UPI0018C24C17|nr:ABC transporter ATP-binding protein [Methylosinus sp. H3A]MBG0809355.1 ABC transporter ATP-binding protein [Methylosinus sp. H3A]